jgi:hypothetical protein
VLREQTGVQIGFDRRHAGGPQLLPRLADSRMNRHETAVASLSFSD